MAGSVLDSGGGRDELKTQFMTREGTYHLMTLAGMMVVMVVVMVVLVVVMVVLVVVMVVMV